MSDCIFCKIANGKAPCHKVYEDDKFIAFLDIHPVHLGHTLVIPKKHSETVIDTDDSTLKELMILVKKISKAIYSGLGLKGFSIGINQFEVGGQIVPHLHIHIMPRYKNDGFRPWPSREYESEDKKKEIQKKITRFLK